MKPTLLMASLLSLAACSATNPCDGKSGGVCIALRVEGNVTGLDQLAVTVDKPAPKTLLTPTPPQLFSLPVAVALLLPEGTSGAVTVGVEGRSQGREIAYDQGTVVINGGAASLTVTLNNGVVPDLTSTTDDGGGVPDLIPPGVTIAGTAAKTIYETEAMNLGLLATDPKGSTLTLSAGTLPTGASFAANGAGGTLTWTPDYKQAGTYMIDFTATSSDATRTVTQTLVLTVAQYADPVLDPLSPGNFLFNAVPIGDFDKDGYGDLAVCSGIAGNYQVRLLFGDATGLPLAAPYPAPRTKLYQFPPGSASTAAYCYGGDYDGDGNSDVIFQDINQTGGRIFVLFGSNRVIDMPPVAELIKPSPVAGTVGGELIVGDWNGDKKMDVACHVYPNGTADARLFIWLGGARTNNAAPVIFTAPGGFNCYAGQVWTFGDVDKDGKDDIIEQDSNVGLASPIACNLSGNFGGPRILHGAPGAPTKYEDYIHPPGGGGRNARWGYPMTLCDVDRDGAADLIIGDTEGARGMYFFYSDGTKIVSPSPMDLSQQNPINPSADFYSGLRCVHNFYGPNTIVLPNSGPFMAPYGPGQVDLVLGGNRTPAVDKVLRSPDGADKQFGRNMASGSADLNGDGKQDIVIGSQSKLWVLYGR